MFIPTLSWEEWVAREPESTAIVSGAGTGIGRATVLLPAESGYRAALFGRRPQPLKHVADQIAVAGGSAVPAGEKANYVSGATIVVDGGCAAVDGSSTAFHGPRERLRERLR
jgi:NAD(P)-dependent dehydrogenase (short-subunit alcohol dehydrogenase family)